MLFSVLLHPADSKLLILLEFSFHRKLVCKGKQQQVRSPSSRAHSQWIRISSPLERRVRKCAEGAICQSLFQLTSLESYKNQQTAWRGRVWGSVMQSARHARCANCLRRHYFVNSIASRRPRLEIKLRYALSISRDEKMRILIAVDKSFQMKENIQQKFKCLHEEPISTQE